MLTKAEAWSYEKEWRLVRKEQGTAEHKPLLNIQAKAAYLGMNMLPEHKATIKEICSAKNIPCYQMAPQYFNSSYEIVPLTIE